MQACQQIVAAFASGRLPAPVLTPQHGNRINDVRYAPHYAPRLGKCKGAVKYCTLDVALILTATDKKKSQVTANRWVRCAMAVLACWELRLIDQDFLDNLAMGTPGYTCQRILKECNARLRAVRKDTRQACVMRERRIQDTAVRILAGPKERYVPFTPIPEAVTV
jgi:hypothetical protein